MSQFTPKVRGGWTKEKILRYLKRMKSGYGKISFWKTVDRLGSFEEFKKNLYWHGTASYFEGGLKPSIIFSKRWEDSGEGGGGYGQKYWTISLSKSKKTASNFSSTKEYVSVYAVILKPNTHIIDGKDLTGGREIEDSADLEDYIEELWNKGLDAVWIGGGEQELSIVNPECCVVGPSENYRVYNQRASDPSDDELLKMWEMRHVEIDAGIQRRKEELAKKQEEKDKRIKDYDDSLVKFKIDLEDYKNDKIGRYDIINSFNDLKIKSEPVFKTTNEERDALLQIAKEKNNFDFEEIKRKTETLFRFR